MGIVEHVLAQCPTPGCKGELYDQVKTGDFGSYQVPEDGFMDAREAQAVDGCLLTCHACGAQARVKADEIPQVRVRLTDVILGDTNKTICETHYNVNAISDDDKSYLAHLKGKKTKLSLEEYLEHQKKAGLHENEPQKRFKYVENGVRYECRMWHEFKSK